MRAETAAEEMGAAVLDSTGSATLPWARSRRSNARDSGKQQAERTIHTSGSRTQ